MGWILSRPTEKEIGGDLDSMNLDRFRQAYLSRQSRM